MKNYVDKDKLQEFATKLHNKQKTIFASKTDVGSPLVASTVSGMTDQTKVYVYTGSETGYTSGNWYYYDGSAWVSGGIYNATVYETDKTLSETDKPADSKIIGESLNLKTFIVPRCMYWGHLYSSRGNLSDVPQNNSTKYFEFRQIDSVLSPVTFKVNSNSLGIQISDNLINDVIWTDKLTFNAGETIRFIVRYNEGADDIDVNYLSYITATMSEKAFNELFNRDDNIPYAYSSSAIKEGTLTTFAGQSSKFPVINTDHPINVITNTSLSTSRVCHLFNQTGSTLTNIEFNLNTAATGHELIPPVANGDFSWVSTTASISYMPAFVSLKYSNDCSIRKVFNKSLRRIDAATYYNNNYYMVGRDKSYLIKIEPETLTETQYSDLAPEGHVNGSNILNGKWYVSAGDPCETITVYDLTLDTPTKEVITFPITTYFPEVEWSMYQPINDNVWISLAAGNNRGMLITWYYHGSQFVPAEVTYIPILGYFQDFIIVDDILYSPISKYTTPNQYQIIGMLYINMKTKQVIISSSTRTEECEAIYEHDNSIYLTGVTGTTFHTPKYNFDWDNYPSLLIAPSDFTWN